MSVQLTWGFPCGAGGKEPACQGRRRRDVGSIPGVERSPGGGHGNPHQYPCLENPMDRRAWRATVPRVAESTKRLGTRHIVDLECCVSVGRVAQWFTYTCAYIGYFSDPFPLCAGGGLIAKSCPTLCDLINCSPPGSSVHGILQVRILEWVAMPSSRGSF